MAFNTLNPNAGGIDIFGSNPQANGPSAATGEFSIIGTSLPPEIMRTTFYSQTKAETDLSRIMSQQSASGRVAAAIQGARETVSNAFTSVKNAVTPSGNWLGGIWTDVKTGAAKIIIIVALIAVAFFFFKALAVRGAAKIA